MVAAAERRDGEELVGRVQRAREGGRDGRAAGLRVCVGGGEGAMAAHPLRFAGYGFAWDEDVVSAAVRGGELRPFAWSAAGGARIRHGGVA